VVEGGSGGGGRPQWGGALLRWERRRWGEPATAEFSGPPNSHDSGRCCRGDTAQLGHRPAERGMGMEQIVKSSINRCVRTPPLTARQIHCTRQIDADTDQSSESRVGADTVQSSGLRLYSRSPKNSALQQLQKSAKSASTTPRSAIWNY